MRASGLALAGLILLAALWGCASDEGPREVLLDTPALHVSNGFQLVEAGKLGDAQREFEAALVTNKEYPAAYVGLSLVASRQGRVDEARGLLVKAEGLSHEDWDLAQVQIGRMELLMADTPPDWLTQVEIAYTRATSLAPRATKAAYVLAQAYLQALEFERARNRFAQVAEQGDSYAYLAREGVSLCQRVLDAEPRTELAKRTALIRSINRAQMAELLVAEIDYPWPPAPLNLLANDLHPQLPQIEAINRVLAAKFQGLPLHAGGAFLPTKPVRRQELAQAALGVVTLVSGRPNPRPSPFPPDISDLPPEEQWQDIISLALDLGLMEPTAPGRFDPWSPVSGSIALSAIKKAERLGHRFKEGKP